MRAEFRLSDLIPSKFVAETVSEDSDTILVTARAASPSGCCPLCGTTSSRVHSRYGRTVSDLPCCGRRVELRVEARRFVCTASHCRQKIFSERFGDSVLPARSRRTARLEYLVHHLGLALGGRPAASFAKRLMLPVSNDTLLRVVRRRARLPIEPLTVVGIDDWAFRRNCRYGTIVCDLERHRIVKLLPDREIDTVAAFLAGHTTIKVLSRDRGGGYGEAGIRSLPGVVQVADRWHLMENASAVFLDAVRKSMHSIRVAIGATIVDSKLLSAAERLQYEGFIRREEANAAIVALHKQGVPIKEIVRRVGHSRGLVRKVIRGLRSEVFRTRESTLDRFLSILDEEWCSGCRNGAELWRRLKTRGFSGSLRVVTEWATRRRRSEQTTGPHLQKVPSARTIARMLTVGRDHLTKAETVTVTTIERDVPMLSSAREIIDDFHSIIRTRTVARLDPWVEAASSSLVASFARGIIKDHDAVHAAVTEPWSNGQTEGHINRLKVVKRQMYGRAKIDLLEARLIGAT
ncbi:ISL3 family transposase [Neorhizobium galegae]|uniref:ISL3 family transposase n=1 Tax=Neorhizobium galegae TaxID=399 RepID=UPI001354D3D8|nr:ISL3 family transposase [Neorhizobium galegae]KAB1108641.1 ISL3 family transposase [Neorhizobium galegae]MCQ1856084.1 ISL3 family transposase [Neorhizobium galegae]